MQRSCLKHYHTIILMICICECIRFIENSARQLVGAFPNNFLPLETLFYSFIHMLTDLKQSVLQKSCSTEKF